MSVTLRLQRSKEASRSSPVVGEETKEREELVFVVHKRSSYSTSCYGQLYILVRCLVGQTVMSTSRVTAGTGRGQAGVIMRT